MIKEIKAIDLSPGDQIMIRSMGGDLVVDVDSVIDIGNGTIKLELFEPSVLGELYDTVNRDLIVRKIIDEQSIL